MCGILAFLPVSCSDDSPVTGSSLLPEAPEGKVNVFLSLHKGSDYESPATRSGTAADETIMGPGCWFFWGMIKMRLSWKPYKPI